MLLVADGVGFLDMDEAVILMGDVPGRGRCSRAKLDATLGAANGGDTAGTSAVTDVVGASTDDALGDVSAGPSCWGAASSTT